MNIKTTGVWGSKLLTSLIITITLLTSSAYATTQDIVLVGDSGDTTTSIGWDKIRAAMLDIVDPHADNPNINFALIRYSNVLTLKYKLSDPQSVAALSAKINGSTFGFTGGLNYHFSAIRTAIDHLQGEFGGTVASTADNKTVVLISPGGSNGSDGGTLTNPCTELTEPFLTEILNDAGVDLYFLILGAETPSIFNCHIESDDSNVRHIDSSPLLADWFIDLGTLSDTDNDGVLNTSDNCPLIANTGQANNDGDSAGDACDADDDNDGVLDTTDNCQFTSNSTQDDGDTDGQGDVCDGDIDGDMVANADDNCPVNPNADQLDTDVDGYGDDCDTDDDNDTVLDADDNCAINANTDQSDLPDNDGIGDVCDADDDNDSYLDNEDNCPINANSGQEDADNDGAGNACDNDDDADSILDINDNCPLTPNFDQNDQDEDGQGDVCDGDNDDDGVANETDNCPVDANAGQDDFDNDNVGDACDSDIDGDGVLNGSDICLMTPLGGIVDSSNGCTIAQLCPCAGPQGVINDWRNHGKYVSCTAKTSENFVNLGLISEQQKDVIVSEAAQSECGVKTKK